MPKSFEYNLETDLEMQEPIPLEEKDIGSGYDTRRSSFGSNSSAITLSSSTLMIEESNPTPAKGETANKISFIIWTIVNTLATIGIVFVNKSIFASPFFPQIQTSFAAFHFLCTTLTLCILSLSCVGILQPKRCKILEIFPLAIAMCFNVVLPNLSLAYSTVTFYQVARILLTPCTAAINFMFYGITIPGGAIFMLIPLCFGVGVVSYYDTLPSASSAAPVQFTSALGVVFAFSGVVASSLYTVWISRYHKKLEMSSMQLLFNQVPVSTGLMLCFVPLADKLPDFTNVEASSWVLVFMSGGFAALINLSQFFIVAGAGAVSSTVVGHAKTCAIIALGWAFGGRGLGDWSLLGILLAIGGTVGYSWIMATAQRKA